MWVGDIALRLCDPRLSLAVGVLCAAPMFDSWFRAQIVQAYPDRDECDIKFVDFGGYASMHGSMLRQIR